MDAVAHDARRFGAMSVIAVPPAPPPPVDPYRILVAGLGGYADGLYPIDALSTCEELPPRLQHSASPAKTSVPPANVWSLLDDANVVFFGRDALPDGSTTDRLNRDFRPFAPTPRSGSTSADERRRRPADIAVDACAAWRRSSGCGSPSRPTTCSSISAGHFTRWHVWSAFYDAQAEGILHGHLYLPEAPSRALMALTQPVRPRQHAVLALGPQLLPGPPLPLLGPGARVHRRGDQVGCSTPRASPTTR